MSLCPTLLTGGTRALGKGLFLDCQSGKCQEKQPRLVSHSFFLPPSPEQIPVPATPTLWRVLSSIGGATPRKRLEVGTPTPGDMEPTGFSKLFQPRGSTSFGCSRRSFTAGRSRGSGGSGPLQRGAGTPGPRGRAHWLVHPPQLPQPHDCPSLGTKPAQASGMCQQPRAPRPEGNRVNILFS